MRSLTPEVFIDQYRSDMWDLYDAHEEDGLILVDAGNADVIQWLPWQEFHVSLGYKNKSVENGKMLVVFDYGDHFTTWYVTRYGGQSLIKKYFLDR